MALHAKAMDMSGMDMATSTGMSMPMSTSSSSGDMSMTMDMSQMTMVFFTSTTTPLWSKSFAPKTTGQYSGVCIFLIAFAAVFRMLLAVRANFHGIRDAARRRQNQGLLPEPKPIDPAARRPWKANEAIMLGAADLVIAGVSYLLMLAVMTMNVGYFLSVLAGIFVGSVLFGRFSGGVLAH